PTLTLVNIYGPNYDDPVFFNNLLLRLATVEGYSIVGGDFNLVLNPSLDRSTPKSISLSKAATVLKKGIKDKGITEVWRSLHPKQKDFSCYSGTHNTYSKIDMFLVPQDMMSSIKDCSYLAATFSDHNPLKLIWTTNSLQFLAI
uniref:Endonuclease/exonuclease/phosphatase domain-containing protein n=1 Tax=Labrus bergylta TaxID=56723 RepID=A0A3Q3EAI0_9LABR